jgi:two-component system invasion response regulator UvrY
MKKILICDDHKIVRDGLMQILMTMPGTNVIEEAGNAKDALNLIQGSHFDIMILDISLPDRNGMDVLQLVKEKSPSTNVLMLSMHPQEQYAIRALKLGASGYLVKTATSDELILAIERIFENGSYISKALAENLAMTVVKKDFNRLKHESLSSREFEIMLKLANGKTLKDIGEELFISNKTVGTYRSRLMEKMKLKNNTDLTKYCMENKLM